MQLSNEAQCIIDEVCAHILEDADVLCMSAERISADGGPIVDSLRGTSYYAIYDTVELHPKCGTAGCLAGWICAVGFHKLNPHIPLEECLWKSFHTAAADEVAADYLGVDLEIVGKLYYVINWPEPFKSDFGTENHKKRAEVAVARLKHWTISGQ